LRDEETYGNHHVALLSYELWQRRFGGQTNLLGQGLTLDGESFTVIGVMPSGTISPDGARSRDLWLPLAFSPDELRQRHAHNYAVYARLKPGVTLGQARNEMAAVARRMAEADAQNIGWGTEVYPLHEIIVGDSQRLLLVLLVSVGLVLLIGCANIASLLLARSVGRMREFAIRAALGASRGAIIRQLLKESCLLAGIGSVLGVVLARMGLNLLIRFSPPDLPRMDEGIPLDGFTLGFTILITILTGILFGLPPAWQASNPALARDLGASARVGGTAPHHQLGRSVLVVTEVALSVILLTGAGLTIRSFERLLAQNPGYVPENLITMSLSLPLQKYPQQAERARLFDALLPAIRAIPGVQSAGCGFGVPLTSVNSSLYVAVPDAPPPAPGDAVAAGYCQVSPGYFATMKTPFLKGRDFTEHDDTNAPPVMIVDETFARILKLGSDPIGRRLFVGDGTENVEIIGLVRDVKKVDMAGAMRGEMYRSYRQMCWGYQTIVVRTQRDPMDLTRAVRRELDRLDKDLPMERVWTMSQLVAANVSQRRLSVQLLTGFAVGALLLSALGLYGVLAYMVGQRTREIGVRMALGAQRASVLRLIIGQGLKLGLAGLLIGLAGAWALTRVLERLLYEIKPNDPWTFGCVAAVLAVVAVLACWLPARRATRIEPIEALRRDF